MYRLSTFSSLRAIAVATVLLVVAACSTSNPAPSLAEAADPTSIPASTSTPLPTLSPSSQASQTPTTSQSITRANNSGSRLFSQSLERHELPGGQSVELLRVEKSAGKVVGFNVILGSGAASKASLEHSRIKIFVDGELEPVTDLELVDFFYTRGFAPGDGNPTRWLADLVGVSSYFLRAGDPFPIGRIGFYRFVDIPFRSSMVIELHNGDGANPAGVFSQVEYLVHTDSPANQPAFEYRTAAYERVILHPGESIELVDVEGRAGYIDSVYLAVWEEAGKSFHWPEMNMVGRFGDDPSKAYDSSGTEDFFFSSWAWSAGAFARRLHGHPVHRQNGWNSQYRYFSEGLWFDDGITFTWEPGPTDAPELTAGGDVGTVEVWALVTYYLSPDQE